MQIFVAKLQVLILCPDGTAQTSPGQRMSWSATMATCESQSSQDPEQAKMWCLGLLIVPLCFRLVRIPLGNAELEP